MPDTEPVEIRQRSIDGSIRYFADILTHRAAETGDMDLGGLAIALGMTADRAKAEITELQTKLQVAERQAAELAAQLTERLAALQDGNEGAYRELYDAMNGPHFCADRPFGQTATAEQVTA